MPASTHLEEPLLVVAIPDVDDPITSTSGKRAKHWVVGDGIHRVDNVHTSLSAPVTLQQATKQPGSHQYTAHEA